MEMRVEDGEEAQEDRAPEEREKIKGTQEDGAREEKEAVQEDKEDNSLPQEARGEMKETAPAHEMKVVFRWENIRRR